MSGVLFCKWTNFVTGFKVYCPSFILCNGLKSSMPTFAFRTTYSGMNSWMGSQGGRTVPRNIPVTLSDGNWKEIKFVSFYMRRNRETEYYFNLFLLYFIFCCTDSTHLLVSDCHSPFPELYIPCYTVTLLILNSPINHQKHGLWQHNFWLGFPVWYQKEIQSGIECNTEWIPSLTVCVENSKVVCGNLLLLWVQL